MEDLNFNTFGDVHRFFQSHYERAGSLDEALNSQPDLYCSSKESSLRALLRSVGVFFKRDEATTESASFKELSEKNRDIVLDLSRILDLDVNKSYELWRTYLKQELVDEVEIIIDHTPEQLLSLQVFYHKERCSLLHIWITLAQHADAPEMEEEERSRVRAFLDEEGLSLSRELMKLYKTVGDIFPVFDVHELKVASGNFGFSYGDQRQLAFLNEYERQLAEGLVEEQSLILELLFLLGYVDKLNLTKLVYRTVLPFTDKHGKQEDSTFFEVLLRSDFGVPPARRFF